MDFLLHHMLRSSAARYPDKHALVHGTQRLTYREVERQVKALGRFVVEGDALVHVSVPNVSVGVHQRRPGPSEQDVFQTRLLDGPRPAIQRRG